MASTTTTPAIGSAVTCRDAAGNVVTGTVTDIESGECRGGGIAFVKAVWPGGKRASVRLVELADVEVAA
jgi:hypothetical protein